MDDREIVAAIAAGDPGGLAEAYDEYAESLYGYCHRMLGEPEDAAYAIQDTFVIAAARLGDLRDPRKLRPWLYAVAATSVTSGCTRPRSTSMRPTTWPTRQPTPMTARSGPNCAGSSGPPSTG